MTIDFSKEAYHMAVIKMCLNGLNPKDYMFMGKYNGHYEVKHVITRMTILL